MDRFGFSGVAARAAVPALALAFVTGVLFTPAASSQTPSGGSPAPTPRLANGKPDLSGMWDGTAGGNRTAARFVFDETVQDDGDVSRLFPSRRCAPNQKGCRDNTNQANDGELTGRTSPLADAPQYKPEHWDRVQFLDYDTNYSEPIYKCEPIGLPRIGAPRKIVQTPDEVIFFYGGDPARFQLSNDRDFRVIPTNGRKHDPDSFPLYYGDSIGYWEGDTLVIDSVSFTDTTRLGSHGYFHSHDMHVVERLRREGDVVHYTVTVEDPTVLLQPWVRTRQLYLNRDPNVKVIESLPCREYDSEITVSRIRH